MKNICLENSCTQKQQILHQNVILFLDRKNLLKDLTNFWCCDHDCASIAAHSSENFYTRIFLYIYFKTGPPLLQKTPNLVSNCHFVFSWKSIYWKRWLVFDGSIRVVCQLLQNSGMLLFRFIAEFRLFGREF